MKIVEMVFVGVGGTALIDLWALVLRVGFGVQSLNYCMLGRWVMHMRRGTFVHAAIGAAPAERHECKVGWVTHYSIGVGLALLFVLLVRDSWLERPTVIPALGFGIATVVIPFFTMQPAFGLGVAASRARNPAAARLKSLATHSVFGLGLFGSAYLLNRLAA
jgi:hypothetical protein